MPIQFDAALVKTSQLSAVVAGLVQAEATTCYRLEASPDGDGYDEALAARVADPLWLLGRQWQFREFDGEDAGSPLNVAYRFEGARVLGVAPGIEPAAETFGPLGDQPLETRIEAEPVWSAAAPHPRAVAEAGRLLARLAGDAGLPALAEQALTAYPLALAAPPDPLSDSAGLLWHLLLDRRCIDAARLGAALRPLRGADGALTDLPAALRDAGADDAALPVLGDWLAWLDEFITEGDGAAWQPERLEYAFELSAGRAPGQRWRLDADAYTDGRIDWHDFDLRPAPDAPPQPEADGRLDDAADRHSFATPVVYPGMPATRYWAFEDGQVNFARIDAAKLDLVRMMVAEYALVHGDDWFLVPARLPAGALYRVSRLQVTDSFGVVTAVPPAGPEAGDGGLTWRLQGLSAARRRGGAGDPAVPAPGDDAADGHWLFLPPAGAGTLEGDPLEQVAFARDEVANLVWAIEQKVQGTSGEPLDRGLEDTRYALGQQPAVSAAGAPLLYRLMTAVPGHWIPLLPTRGGGNLGLDIGLLRGAMKRFYRQDPAALAAQPELAELLARLRASGDFIEVLAAADAARADDLAIFAFHPRGRLLRTDPGVAPWQETPLRIAEEEVGRDGVVVERRFQYARTPDGRRWLWIGRRKRIGRGEAASGLRFDLGVSASVPPR